MMYKLAKHKEYAIYYIAMWTLVITCLMILNIYQSRRVMRDAARTEARASFNKDQAFRFWATSHGGVYVPIDERTPPNPYLDHIPERDIETPSGVRLTLMNPAYLMRQINEDFADLYGIVGHLTSLDPLRARNAPDEWERAALEIFELGETQVIEFSEINGESYLRLMQPVLVEEGCLKCHGHQGYEVGDIRGGISVSVPMPPHIDRSNQEITRNLLSFSMIWVMGLIGIGIGSRSLGLHLQERENAENALRESEMKYRNLVENSLFGVASTSISGELLYLNATGLEIPGYESFEEVQAGGLLLRYKNPADREYLLNVLQESGRVDKFELEILTKTGDTKTIIVSAFIDGDVLNSAFIDVTERKQMEESLRESEKRLYLLIQNIPTAIVVHRADTTIMQSNTKAQEILGLTEAQILGKTANDPYWKFVEKDGRAMLLENYPVNRVLASGEVLEHLLMGIYRFDIDSTIWVLVNAIPEINQQGEISRIIVTFIDVTERKQMENEREKLLSELGNKNAELERFTYTVSHDLKSPIITIKGFLGLLEKDALEGNVEALKKDIAFIVGATDKMSQLLGELLNLSRIGRIINPPEQISLEVIVNEALDSVSGINEGNFSLEIMPNLPLVYVDRIRIREVFENLISNAVKYMGEQANPRIEIGIRENNNETVIYVQDNGIGIDPKYHETVFGLFEQLDQSVEGSGIGLATVKRIVEAHNGRIWIESDGKNQGSTFCFTIP